MFNRLGRKSVNPRRGFASTPSPRRVGTSEMSSAKIRDNQQSGKVVFTNRIFLEAAMIMLFTKIWLKLLTNYDLQKFR